MKKPGLLIYTAILCLLMCTACGQRPEPETTVITEKKAEPAVTCEITGYSQYTGQYKDMFLKKGDKIAVISPSSIPSQKQVDATVSGLKKWGYVPVKGKHVYEKVRTLEDCLEDLIWALEEPSIKAIFCVRGGYGASEVMDILPADLIAASGKLIIGYSDITVFHSAWTASGLPSIHASMAAAFMDLPEDCSEAEQHMLNGEIPSYRCEGSSYLKKGSAEGILTGGNLATFTSVIGTEYESTDTDQPYILFFEDVEEDLQHLHRYLTILKHNGVLEGAAGIIFGEWTALPADTGDYDGDSRGGDFGSVTDMICRDILEEYDIPIAFDFPAGHGEDNYPLLMGEKVRFTVSDDSFTLEWVY